MNKILFSCKNFEVRVRDVVIVIIVCLMIVMLILLFFCMKTSQEKEVQKKKTEKIVSICDVTVENIDTFDELMARADLCSEGWFKDMDAYILRIEDQNEYLQKQEKTKYKLVKQQQVALLKRLKAFKKSQEVTTLNELEKAFKGYKKLNDDTCVKGKKG